MALLSSPEALRVSDSFLSSLYGDDIFRKWKELKYEMKFNSEREYVIWLIDVANHYKQGENETVTGSKLQDPSETDANFDEYYTDAAVVAVKCEENVDEYNEVSGRGKNFESSESQEQTYSECMTQYNAKVEQGDCEFEQLAGPSNEMNPNQGKELQKFDVPRPTEERFSASENSRLMPPEGGGEIVLSSDDDGDMDAQDSGAGEVFDDPEPTYRYEDTEYARSRYGRRLKPYTGGGEYEITTGTDLYGESYGGKKKRVKSQHKAVVRGRARNTSMRYHENGVKKRAYSRDGERPYGCEVCGNSFKMLQHLKKHLITGHSGTMNSVDNLAICFCSLCGEAFDESGQLKIHVSTFHDDAQKQAYCDECGSTFARAYELRRHMIRKHGQESEYRCERCGRYLTSPAELERHVQQNICSQYY